MLLRDKACDHMKSWSPDLASLREIRIEHINPPEFISSVADRRILLRGCHPSVCPNLPLPGSFVDA